MTKNRILEIMQHKGVTRVDLWRGLQKDGVKMARQQMYSYILQKHQPLSGDIRLAIAKVLDEPVNKVFTETE